MNSFSFHVPASHYRRRPRVRFSSHWERTARRQRFARVCDLLIFAAGLASMAAFAFKVLA